MSTDNTPQSMTPEQEYEFYADPRNQEPQGPPRRRKPPLSTPVPVRFRLTCSSRSSRPQKLMTARSRLGSAAPSSTNSPALPEHLPLAASRGRRQKRVLGLGC